MGKKSTKYEKEARVEEVRRMELSGASREEIVIFAKEKWHIAERTVDWYIAEAREKNLAILSEMPDETLAKAIAVRRLLRSQAHERDNLRLEFKIAQDEARLLGLYNIDSLARINQTK